MSDTEGGAPQPRIVANGWKILKTELISRTKHPLSQFTFCAYFFIGVILFGGLGFWFEWLRFGRAPAGASASSMLTALVTFFPALVGSTAVQMIFEEDDDRRLRAFAVVTAVIFAAVAGGLTFAEPSPWAFLLAALACCAALWVWWVANAYNPAFQDDGSPDDAVGGPPSTPPTGDLTGFKV